LPDWAHEFSRVLLRYSRVSEGELGRAYEIFEETHLNRVQPPEQTSFQKTISEKSCQDSAVIEKAFFATGCFWGAERRFWNLPGVISTSVGYMGGHKTNPTYKEVCSGSTNHAETVEVEFDPTQIPYIRLLEEFWTMHDPTSLNRQGGDIGTQYRSAIFTTTEEQMIAAINTREIYNELLTSKGFDEIVTEIQEAKPHVYWLAEEYHQRYLEKNPDGYDCHSSTGIPFPKVKS
jgi:peptide-methionine (S)-S-oxide reductase